MQNITSQCTGCGLFERRSLHHEEQYQSSGPLERLRTSNLAATDEEMFHVQRTILPTISDDISSIDFKLAALQKVITSMEKEREKLHNVQKKYSSLITLHRALPVEIISKIFLDTLSNGVDFNAFHTSGPIWQLSHVCQRWRNVALSLRSFWSTMLIRFPEAAQHEGNVQRLETIIQRSLHGPLDLSLIGDCSDQSSNPSIQKRMFELIFAESYRWRNLELPDSRMYGNVLSAPLLNHLPRLESLRLAFRVRNPWGYLSAFEGCPHLRKLSLSGTIPPALHLPWTQITELDLSCVDVDENEDRRACLRLVRQCPSLEFLTMWDSVDDNGAIYTAITCPNLCKLSSASSVPFIDALTLPRLREASLYPEDSSSHFLLSSFNRLLIRSNCLGALARLSLDNLPLAASLEHSLHSILFQTHSLVFLSLVVILGEFDDERDAQDREQIVAIVKSLEVVPTQSITYLPLLSSLNIEVEQHNDSWTLQHLGPVGSFASMVKARWKGDGTFGLAKLERCHVGVHARHSNTNRAVSQPREEATFNAEERYIFNALVDEGMDLSIEVTSDLFKRADGRDTVFAIPP
ncbi:hypothetical protein CPB85DRAFT_791012 [Mucidula mucida]|nr:hypothetical protein CPB85DRAFT_791012 [Mucidula mucida]